MTLRTFAARICLVSVAVVGVGIAVPLDAGQAAPTPTPGPSSPRPPRDPVSEPGGLRPNVMAPMLASGTGVVIVKSTSGPSCTGYSSQTTPPSSIRVLVHGSNGAPTGVVTVPFQQYVRNVLPNEWIASWRAEALKAGAVAAKSYAWYWVTHYGGYYNTQSNCFDVTDDTSFQVYYANSSYPSTDSAVQATWPVVARKGGQVLQTFYRAYLQSSGEGCGAGANGTTMSQWGSQACAVAGRTYSSILHTYYGSNLELYSASTSSGGGGTSGGGGGTSGGGGATGTVGEISSAQGCINVANGTRANSTPLVASSCDGRSSEAWGLGANGSVRAGSTSSTWCMDARAGGTTVGTAVQLYTCNGSAAQTWTWRSDNTIFNAHAGLCVAVSATTSDAPLQLASCSRSSNAQYWNASALQTRHGPIGVGVAAAGAVCVDDQWARTVNKNPIQTYGCNGTPAQDVAVNLPTLRIFGQCIDVAGGGTTNGTKVYLYRCNGTGAQKWTAQSNGSLLNPQSGKCLDVPGGTTAWETQLQIWTCNGTAAQRYSLPQ